MIHYVSPNGALSGAHAGSLISMAAAESGSVPELQNVANYYVSSAPHYIFYPSLWLVRENLLFPIFLITVKGHRGNPFVDILCLTDSSG